MPALNMMFQEKPSTPQFRKETTVLPAAAAQAYNRLYVAGSRRPFQAVRISYAASSDNSSVVQRCGSDSEDDTIKDPDYGKKKKLRQEFMGSTPMKTSLVGKAVIDRMLEDESDDDDTSLYREGSKIFMKTKYSEADLSLTDDATHLDMGHIYPAVKFWNEIGRYTGARSSCVRSFMRDPNNYRIQYGRRNSKIRPQEKYKSVADEINRNFEYISFSAPENFENIDKMIKNLEGEGLR